MGERDRALGELVVDGDVTYGIVQPGSDDADGVPIVRVKDLRNGRVDTGNPLRVADDVSARHRRTVLRGGELIMSIVGTVGEAAVVPNELAGWNVARAIAVLRPDGVSAEWLRLALQTDQVRAEIEGMLNTTVQSTLNLSDLKRLRIPMPPESERRAIAEVLGALDDKIAANDRTAAIAGDLAEQIYRRETALVGAVTMSEVLTPVSGGTPKRSDESLWGGTIPWASAKDITGAPQGVVVRTAESITEAAAGKRLAPLPRGAVVLTARGTVGEVARMGVEASFNQSCYAFLPERIPAACLYFAVREAAGQARAMAHGSVFDTITTRTFDFVTVPDLSTSGWGRLEDKIAPLLESVEALVSESERLAATRDELLPLLMSGKLRVNEVESEVGAVT